ncbi:hypothetical protein BD408DRAFT_411462 [Parasitella parasitica]|nr:hypothetical protein BD408DRAFT_411462 [Parasitella parasitica]
MRIKLVVVNQEKQRVCKAVFVAFVPVKAIAVVILCFHQDKTARKTSVERVEDVLCFKTVVHKVAKATSSLYFIKFVWIFKSHVVFKVKQTDTSVWIPLCLLV